MVSQDDELIQQLLDPARSGSRPAMGHLAVIVRQRLHPFVLSMIPDADAAEDIVQETLLSVMLRLERLRDNSKFWPWVFRITMSKVRDYIRVSRLRAAHKAALALDRSGGARPQDENVLEAQIHAESLRQLCDGIEQLSNVHKDIIRLRYYERLSYAQIASRTSISATSARARSYRAKKQLRSCLI